MQRERWRGQWIWAAGESDPEAVRRVVALRTSFTSSAGSTMARIHAVGRYALWINDVEVCRGPVRANPRRHRYDLIDLAPWLVEGENSVRVLAIAYGVPMPWWNPLPVEPSPLASGAFVFDSAQLVSGEHWEGVQLSGWGAEAGTGIMRRGVEHIGTIDWSAAWSPAVLAGPVWIPGDDSSRPPSYPLGPIGPSGLAPRAPRTVSLADTGDGLWTSPDGLLVGTVSFESDGPMTGQVAERSTPTHNDAAFDAVGSGETLDLYGLTTLHTTGPVTAVRVTERLHPVGGASFECSDELINQIWAAGRRTVTACSLDAYVDCPTREQRAWTGDAVVHQLVDLTTNDDWSLAHAFVHQSAAPTTDGLIPMVVGGDAEGMGRLNIPDWSLHWVHAVHNLWLYSGDAEEIQSLLPTVEHVIRWFDFFTNADGVIDETPESILIDWAAVWVDGVSASLNGLWGRALWELAEMSDWLGDHGRASWARSRHEKLARGFESLWDGHRYLDVPHRRVSSQHGNAAAIIGRLAPESRHEQLVSLLTGPSVRANFGTPQNPAAYLGEGRPEPSWDVEGELVAAQPFYRYVVHDALVMAGRSDLIVNQIRDWKDLLDRCPTTLSEIWTGGSICHGWSATPTRDLMQRVLGVMPASPGFASARITPNLGGLEWARGTVPTPAGPITIEVTPAGLTVDSPIPWT